MSAPAVACTVTTTSNVVTKARKRAVVITYLLALPPQGFCVTQSPWQHEPAELRRQASALPHRNIHTNDRPTLTAETVLAELGEHALAGAMREVAEVLAAVRRNT